MMNYSTPYEALQDAIARYNEGKPEGERLPVIPFHGLRHTSATLLISAHQDIATVSKRLGHAHASVTLDIYTHALEKNDRGAVDALENLLRK
ncbi:MAG: tyrosine-type recombinase/integrase [Oscillospiraceae bacterium]|nr:tyrosine-type recombinase/integrase [Oscillospiraceae bacterium]